MTASNGSAAVTERLSGPRADEASRDSAWPRLPVVLRVLSAVFLTLFVAYALVTAATGNSQTSASTWLLGVILCLAALRCLLRANLVPAQRSAWLIVGVGMLAWATGEILSVAAPSLLSGSGRLSLSDLTSLAFYPAAYTALIVLLGAAVERFSAALWLDGVAGALAVSALVAAFAFPSVLAEGNGGLWAVISNMSYPLADLLLIAVVLFTLAMAQWRPGRVLGLMTTALVLIAIGDAFALWWTSTGHTGAPTVVSWMWPLAAVLVAEAAWQPPIARRSSDPASGTRSLVIPALFSTSALGLLVSGLLFSLNSAGYELAIAALAILVARMVLTAVENVRMAHRSQREALTDALTGLGNRRRLMLDLEASVAQSSARTPVVLMLFDLDGFKRYNDTFGHPAGDALLARMGQTLRQAVGSDARPYRLGGDEFCVLLTGSANAIADVVPSIVAALSEDGGGFSVAPSYGSVLIPHEAVDVTSALQLADQRLYQRKGARRRVNDSQQTRDVLMQVLRERQPALSEHLGGVADMARRVAVRFELSAEEIDRVTRAAELHDIGKMAVPDSILNKPDELDELETALMHQHTIIGERILDAAPALMSVAGLVRASHERYDGAGYPDGLAGADIPLGARIIAVCDAFDAMISGRPYRRAVTAKAAIDELRRCAGGQFDPEVVEVFSEEVEASPAFDPEDVPQPVALHVAANGAPAIERR